MITGRKLDIRGVRDDRGFAPINSAFAPLAEYDTLLQALERQDLKELGCLLSREALAGLHVGQALLYCFLLDSGCRVAEALDLKHGSIMMLGDVIIDGKKGSKERVVVTHLTRHYMLFCRANLIDPFKDVTYDCFYKSLKKLGVGLVFGSNSNVSVTHYFRHLHVLLHSKGGADLESSQRFLGHKSVKSTSSYSKDVKR